jgi:hypothetical protein
MESIMHRMELPHRQTDMGRTVRAVARNPASIVVRRVSSWVTPDDERRMATRKRCRMRRWM